MSSSFRRILLVCTASVVTCVPRLGFEVLGGIPREQKMLKGHLPRVINHQVHFSIRRYLRGGGWEMGVEEWGVGGGWWGFGSGFGVWGLSVGFWGESLEV